MLTDLQSNSELNISQLENDLRLTKTALQESKDLVKEMTLQHAQVICVV